MKKRANILALVVIVILILTLSACSSTVTQGEISAPPSQCQGQIYLYGEQHGVEKILDKEFELWQDYYQNNNLRHLFVELPYFTAEFLNIWMQSDSDDILNEIYEDWVGTAGYNPDVKDFYKKIKSTCPETIFHGTDVGHQYDTTGKRFLKYLEDNNLEASEQYLLTQEAIEQGKFFYEHSDDVYRENKMSENFICEYDRLTGENVMGIYGGAHTGLDAMDYTTGSIPCMANQLKKRYGDAISSEDLTYLANDMEPIRVDTIAVNGKNYEASYFGKQDMSWSDDYSYREFWRLENAYDDFKDRSKTGEVLPYINYPMQIETSQVFVIDYTKKDGYVVSMYYRSDGYVWSGMKSTEEFTV